MTCIEKVLAHSSTRNLRISRATAQGAEGPYRAWSLRSESIQQETWDDDSAWRETVATWSPPSLVRLIMSTRAIAWCPPKPALHWMIAFKLAAVVRAYMTEQIPASPDTKSKFQALRFCLKERNICTNTTRPVRLFFTVGPSILTLDQTLLMTSSTLQTKSSSSNYRSRTMSVRVCSMRSRRAYASIQAPCSEHRNCRVSFTLATTPISAFGSNWGENGISFVVTKKKSTRIATPFHPTRKVLRLKQWNELVFVHSHVPSENVVHQRPKTETSRHRHKNKQTKQMVCRKNGPSK